MKLKNIKRKYKTKELCQAAVMANYQNVEFCPHEYLTKDLLLTAIKKFGVRAFRLIPNYLKTTGMCVLAIKKNSKSIKYVPAERMEKVLEVLESKKSNDEE